jgi:uncharacterized protein
MARSLSARLVDGIGRVPAGEWNACAGSGNPFVSHAFLAALEDSGSVGGKTGWLAQHLVVQDETDRLLAACPLYVKAHSQGEYVFDHGWAEAYMKAGGRYYPKLQVAVPFTPVPGPRLLARPGPGAEEMRKTLIGALIGTVEQAGLSSLHVTFCGTEDSRLLQEAGFLERLGCQYHWSNRGYGDFAEFLGTLSSRKRKAIRRERAAIAAQGVEIEIHVGEAITPADWDSFFAFYMDTGARKWGRPYLTRAFFASIHESMRDQIVLVLAKRDGRFIAGALNFQGADALYGRNWGCIEDVPFLHFECCYYQAIDYAIRHGLSRVEAGAQGEHKIQRGYLPVATRSCHWIVDESFRAAIADYLTRERRVLEHEINQLGEFSPFRRDEATALAGGDEP